MAALTATHAEEFVEAAQDIGYVDLNSVRRAVVSGRSFNIIDDETVTKVDVFVARSGARLAQLGRRQHLEIGDGRDGRGHHRREAGLVSGWRRVLGAPVA